MIGHIINHGTVKVENKGLHLYKLIVCLNNRHHFRAKIVFNSDELEVRDQRLVEEKSESRESPEDRKMKHRF